MIINGKYSNGIRNRKIKNEGDVIEPVPDSKATRKRKLLDILKVNKFKKSVFAENTSYCEWLAKIVVVFFSCVTISMLYLVLIYFLFFALKILNPVCPAIYNRVCNERGICQNGKCECFDTYSGNDCSQTQVLGYDIITNKECNGAGFAYPIVNISSNCISDDGNGPYVDWLSPSCVEHVSNVRTLINLYNNNLALVPDANTVPSCICDFGRSGYECRASSCPVDENNIECSGHGNTSVGLYQNYTNAGIGCQCSNIFSLSEERFRSYFSDEVYNFLILNYNYEFNKLYCGNVVPQLNSTDGVVENYLLLFTLLDDYKCYCDDDWKGNECNEGKCPVDLVTHKTCSGNGHPLFGPGYMKNTTLSQIKNVRCDLECPDGFERCNDKCVPKTSPLPGVSNLIAYNRFCVVKNQCPKNFPIRCIDGSCVQKPASDTLKCGLGFQYGSIDYSQFQQSLIDFRCPNITDVENFEICFKNNTPHEGIIAFENSISGGMVINASYYVNDYIEVNFTSPLIYVQFISNLGNVKLQNFDGQIKIFEDEGLMVHMFQYESVRHWTSLVNYEFIVRTDDYKFYTLFPSPYNFTFPDVNASEFSSFKIVNEISDESLILSIISTELTLTPVDFVFELFQSQGVLVLLNTSNDVDSPYIGTNWLDPNPGVGIVSNNVMQVNPSQYAWFIDYDFNLIRNLEGTLYVCRSLVEPYITLTQETPCIYGIQDLLSAFPETFYTYNTSLFTQSQDDNVNQISLSTGYQKEIFYTTYPLKISLIDNSDTIYNNTLVTLKSFVFLTEDNGIGYPCACDITNLQSNKSELNSRWWIDNNTREVMDSNINIDDYVVFFNGGDGIYNLKRGIIKNVDYAKDVLVVLDIDNTFHTVYFSESRKISVFEYLSGQFDREMIIKPFLCPSGKPADSEVIIEELNVDCNCTLYSELFSENMTSIINYNCSCQDELQFYNKFGCVGIFGDNICGSPSNVIFQNDLNKLMFSLNNGDCKCLFFNGWQAAVNNSFILEGNEASNTFMKLVNTNVFDYTFYIYPENIPEFFVIEFSECDGYESFDILAGSYLFRSDEYYRINYVTGNDGSAISNWVKNCQYYLSLEFDPALVFTNISISTNSTFPMRNITLSFLKYGFSLFNLQENGFNDVVITSSSNQNNVSNILYIGDEGWKSSSSLRENPVYINFNFKRGYYLNSYLIIFRNAGRIIGDYEIPLAGYLQGSNDGVSYYTLDTFSIFKMFNASENPYVYSDYQVYRKVPVFNSTFNTFRILSYGQQLDILHVDLYTNTSCTCENNAGFNGSYSSSDFGVAVQMFNLDGLLNLTSLLDIYIDEINHLNNSIPCLSYNNCTVMNEDATFNGVCNDALYQAFLLGIRENIEYITELIYTPNNFSIFTSEYVYTGYYFTADIPGLEYSSVQFFVNHSSLLDAGEMVEYYEEFNGTNNLVDIDTGLYIYYLIKNSNRIVGLNTQGYEWQWDTNTTNVIVKYTETTFGTLVQNGVACDAGFDVADCGASSRTVPIYPGLTCNPPNPYDKVWQMFNESDILYYRTVYIEQFQNIRSNWYSEIQNLRLTLTLPRLQLLNCGEEVCDKENPYLCDNGKCAKSKKLCDLRYTCPGNGCVELTDASELKYYRCACAPGFDGDACQYGDCRPSSIFINLESSLTPAAQECDCGGLPPFRLKPPLFTKKECLTTEEIIVLNNQVTGNNAPLSRLDIGYHGVMPINAPFGQVIGRLVKIDASSLIPNSELTVCTRCPCARAGYFNESLLLEDDVAFRNPFTGKPTWKVYTNPFTGKKESFPWTSKSICSYDDFRIRCPNGVCVRNLSECKLSEYQNPSCNNRGNCRADSSCSCNNPYSTFLINKELSNEIKYPYTYVPEWNTTNPTAWTLNFNYRLHNLNQCASRDCSGNKCELPKGCFPGTPKLLFKDRLVLCRNNGLCAKTLSECNSGVNLFKPLVCSGKGIPRIKDGSGEYYCYCGDPVSSLLDIGNITDITLLKPNGFGGVGCNKYDADTGAPLFYSTWNSLSNMPYLSLITGEVLPGKLIKGNIIVGPKPEDSLLWKKCCQFYTRLELCPFAPCLIGADIQCLSIQQCLEIDPDALLVEDCNGHGKARADGTCECEADEDSGTGYTADYTQFSYDGCYKLIQCPVSKITKTPCKIIDQCSSKEMLNIFNAPRYYKQQWYLGTGGRGLINNQSEIFKFGDDLITYNDQVQQSLTKTALSVIAAESDYQGCVCYYPNSTDTDRCCMVNDGQNYTYMQAYTEPYWLNVTTTNNYTSIFHGVVNPVGTQVLVNYFTPGMSINGSFDFNETNVIAIRVMSSGGAVLRLVNSINQPLCDDIILLPLPDFDIIYPKLNWNAGELGGALNCGPSYSCVAGKTFDQFQIFCGVKPDSRECLDFLKQQCISAGYIYWPSDSIDVYNGCLRVDDVNGCTCCRQFGSLNTLTDGKFKINVISGQSYIYRIRIYGYSNQALKIVPGLQRELDAQVGKTTGCQDYRFMRSILGSDKSYFVPRVLSTSFYNTSNAVCEDLGGYMAVGELGGNELQDENQAIIQLQRICGNIFQGLKSCWVAAISTLETITVPRREIFVTDCTLWGCYYKNLFYSHGFNFQTSFFTAAGVSKIQARTDTYIANLTSIQSYYNAMLQYYTSTYQLDNGNFALFEQGEDPDLGVIIPVKFTLANNYVYTLYFTTNVDLVKKDNRKYVLIDSFFSMIFLNPSYQVGFLSSPISKIEVLGDTGLIFRPVDRMFCNFAYNSGLYTQTTVNNVIDDMIAYSDKYFISGTYFNYVLDYGPSVITNYFDKNCPIIQDLYNQIHNNGKPVTGQDEVTSRCKNQKCPSATLLCTRATSKNKCCQKTVAGKTYYLDAEFCFDWAFIVGLYRLYCPGQPDSSGYTNIKNVFANLNTGPVTIPYYKGCSCNTKVVNNQIECICDKLKTLFNKPPVYYDMSNLVQNDPQCTIATRVTNDKTKVNTVYTSYTIITSTNQEKDTGTVGLDRVFGYKDHVYMPMFLKGQILPGTLLNRPFSSASARTVLKYSNALVYFENIDMFKIDSPGYGMYENKGWTGSSLVYPCNECIKDEGNLCYWDQKFYSQILWKNFFDCPVPEIYLQLPQSVRRPISFYEVSNVTSDTRVYIHQINYIENYTVRPKPTVNWYLPQCVAVTKNGLEIYICDQKKLNFICQYDYVKMSVLPGTMCDVCGTSTSTGGPKPGSTCQSEFALASPTLFPFQHLVKENYVRGTLKEFADAFNIEPEVFNYENASLILGFPAVYEKWVNNFSNRPGFSSSGVQSDINWQDFCFQCIYNVNCGVQFKARTNEMKRYCATKLEFCNVDLNDDDLKGPRMQESLIPPSLFPVDDELSFTDPSCGYDVELASYIVYDKYGGSQSDLTFYQKILVLTTQYIQIQTTSLDALWFNGGKSVIDYYFDWNITTTVSSQYQLLLCDSCVDPYIEIFIHPLNVEYAFPDVRLSYNISLIKNIVTEFTAEFTVTESETGSYYLNDILFPIITFKGIGFKLHNVDIGASFKIGNFLLTSPTTRTQCQNRDPPIYYEPDLRVESSAPFRLCPLSVDDLFNFPDSSLGECVCDSSSIGLACDTPAVQSKYGKSGCGGFGDAGTKVRGFNGEFYYTSTGVDSGSYVVTMPDGTLYSECKTIDLGRSIYSLLTPSAIFNYPSVYVQTIPLRGSSIFKLFTDNVAPEDFEEALDSCNSQGMTLPFFFTVDEISQFLVETRVTVPVFTGVDNLQSSPEYWKWLIDDETYFMYEPVLTYISEFGDCSGSSCDVINFNNFAFNAEVTNTPTPSYSIYVNDGNTLSNLAGSSTYTIQWDQNSNLIVNIYVFYSSKPSSMTMTCLGGICETPVDLMVSTMYNCRCPARVLTFVVTGSFSEIQIFDFDDTIRSSVYNYN